MLLPPSPITARPKTSSPARRSPSAAHHQTGHLAQVADHRQAASGDVAVVAVPLAAVRGTLGIGHVLAEQVVRRRAKEQVAHEIAVQERDHVAPRPQRHGHAGRRGLVAGAHRHGAFHVALLEQFQEPLFDAAGKEHQRIGRLVELRLRKPPGKPHDLGNRHACRVNPQRAVTTEGRMDPRPINAMGRPRMSSGHGSARLLDIRRGSQLSRLPCDNSLKGSKPRRIVTLAAGGVTPNYPAFTESTQGFT